MQIGIRAASLSPAALIVYKAWTINLPSKVSHKKSLREHLASFEQFV
jgi:hypothetical protein